MLVVASAACCRVLEFDPESTPTRFLLENKNKSVIKYARLAQSVERGTFNPEVKGSSPLSGGAFLKKKLNN